MPTLVTGTTILRDQPHNIAASPIDAGMGHTVHAAVIGAALWQRPQILKSRSQRRNQHVRFALYYPSSK
jgi:hypothetical protein